MVIKNYLMKVCSFENLIAIIPFNSLIEIFKNIKRKFNNEIKAKDYIEIFLYDNWLYNENIMVDIKNINNSVSCEFAY